MVITLKLNGIPTLFIKAFTADHVAAILDFVTEASGLHVGQSNTVLFIDTPITSATVEAIEKLKFEGFRPVVRDHHGLDGEPTNDRERQVLSATKKLKTLLADDCLVTVRRLHPACSTLVATGEFANALAIIADPDADGLTAAMKAAGIFYPELDDDAAKLDSEPQLQVTGSAISQLLAKGIATIPSYDASRPKEREIAHQKLFADWVKAVQGDSAAVSRLEECAVTYDAAVETAKQIAAKASFVAPHVVLADTADKELYDPGTLAGLLEAKDGCRVSVIRKSLGPIAAVHRIQYSLAVPRAFQEEIDLQRFVASNVKSDPDAGIISNVSFLLHVSETIWQTQVLPELKRFFSK